MNKGKLSSIDVVANINVVGWKWAHHFVIDWKKLNLIQLAHERPMELVERDFYRYKCISDMKTTSHTAISCITLRRILKLNQISNHRLEYYNMVSQFFTLNCVNIKVINLWRWWFYIKISCSFIAVTCPLPIG